MKIDAPWGGKYGDSKRAEAETQSWYQAGPEVCYHLCKISYLLLLKSIFVTVFRNRPLIPCGYDMMVVINAIVHQVGHEFVRQVMQNKQRNCAATKVIA